MRYGYQSTGISTAPGVAARAAASRDAAAVRRDLETNGLEATVASAFLKGVSPVSDNAAERASALQHLKDLIRTSADAGAKVFAGPMYSPVGYLPGRRRTADEWKRAVEGLQTIGDTLATNGVTLAIEPLNRFETYFLNTAVDAARLCDEINHPNIGILFDTFHANIEEKNVAAGIRTVGRHLRHVAARPDRIRPAGVRPARRGRHA